MALAWVGLAAPTNRWALGHWSAAEGLPPAPVTALTQTRDGFLWVGTAAGVARFDGRRFVTFGPEQFPHAEAGFHPVALAEDSWANLWVATTEGVYRRATNGFVHVVFFEATNASPVRSLILRRTGGVWVGTDRGLFEPSDDHLRPVWKSPVTDPVEQLVETGAGLGVATPGRVWLRKPDGVWQTLWTNTVPNSIPSIAADQAPFLWVAAHDGLWRQVGTANPRLVPIKWGRGGNYRFAGEARAEGRWLVEAGVGLWRASASGIEAVPGTEPSRLGGIMAFTVDTLDRVWLGTTNGLMCVQRADEPASEPPAVAVEALRWAGGEVRLDSPRRRSLRLPPEAAEGVEFSFVAPLRLPADNVRFAYRLSTKPDDWSESAEPVARFTGLSAGHHVFEVRAKSARGAWGSSRTVAFEVEPDFLHSPAFRVWLAIFGSGLVAASAWWRIRLRSRHVPEPANALLSAERDRIARDLHDDIGSQLTALALQAELLKRRADPELAAGLDLLAAQARGAAGRMGEIVWELNPACDTLASFGHHLAEHAEQWAQLTNTRFRAEIPPDLPADAMCPEARRHLALVVREALANVAKHSGATEAKLVVRYGPDNLFLSVQDNGRGFDPAETDSTPAGQSKNGVRNQRRRIEELGGTLELRSRFGGGTRLDIVVPLAALATGRK